jgi:hypothetical protein
MYHVVYMQKVNCVPTNQNQHLGARVSVICMLESFAWGELWRIQFKE